MKDIALFTDVSVNPGLRLGIGAYLVMPASLLEASGEIDSAELTDQIKVQRFENSSSTKLELQTVLWAIGEQRKALKGKIRIYSDSQCVSGLLKRRARLVAENFVSSRTTLPLKNAPLYRSFYECHDELDFEVVKVKGHGRVSARDKVHRIFSLVDKSARKALRLWMDELAEATDASAGSVQDENWCVYLLRCRNNSLYTGMTNNIVRRLKEHEQGRGSKFVRSWRPFELVKTIPCRNAGEARRLEYELKRLTRKEKLDRLGLPLKQLR